jgi:hypothetical protein
VKEWYVKAIRRSGARFVMQDIASHAQARYYFIAIVAQAMYAVCQERLPSYVITISVKYLRSLVNYSITLKKILV